MPKKLTKRAAARQLQAQTPPTGASTPVLPLDGDGPPLPFFDHPTVRRWLPALALALLAFVFLFPTLHAAYIWDDDQWLTNNGLITEPGLFSKIWIEPTASPQYYPLVFTTYWIEFRLFHGLGRMYPDGIFRGVGFHFDNLLLHIGSALLIYLILKKLKLPGGKLGAWLAAAIFAIHPVSVESVAWIAERKNCLGGLLFFAALFYGFKFFRVIEEDNAARQDRFRWWHFAAALLLFILSMFSKTTACIIGPVFLLMIWWRRGRIRLNDIFLSIPFFLVAAVMGAFTALMEVKQAGTTGPEWNFSILQRILIAGSDFWFYLEKLLVPYPLMQIYPRFNINAGHPVTNPIYYIAPIAFLALIIVLFLLRKKISRGPLTAILFFAGVVAPALGFINFYTMVYTFVADHYQYYACIGFIVLFVETLLFALRKVSQAISATPEAGVHFFGLTRTLLAVGILLPLGMLTLELGNLYHDDERLWSFNVEHNPTCSAAYTCLADACQKRVPPKLDEAVHVLHEALEIDPTAWRAYHDLGTIYLGQNKFEEAEKDLAQAEKLMPPFVREGRAKLYARQAAAAVDPAQQKGRATISYSPQFLIARKYQDNGQWAQAITFYQRDIQEYPGDLQAYVNIGVCYVALNDNRSAVAWFERAIDRYPKKPTDAYPRYADAWLHLGLSLNALGQKDQSTVALQRAIDIDPQLVEIEILKAKSQLLRQDPDSP